MATTASVSFVVFWRVVGELGQDDGRGSRLSSVLALSLCAHIPQFSDVMAKLFSS